MLVPSKAVVIKDIADVCKSYFVKLTLRKQSLKKPYALPLASPAV